MKKLVLLIALVFSMNLSAAQLLGQVSVNTSMCNVWGYSWTHYVNNDPMQGINDPEANICFDIRNIYAEVNGWDNGSYGSATTTAQNLEGSFMYILVDVFGVPADEPTVMYNYQTLNAVAYEQIVNYNSSPAIINGRRYWFLYNGNIGSGDIIVKHYANYVDELHVQ